MKSNEPNLSWLPPREEWDFRGIPASECRIACHWEYSRELRLLRQHHGLQRESELTGGAVKRVPPQEYYPSNYRQSARELFPRPWMTLTKEQRGKVIDSFTAMPVLQVRKLKDFFERMQWADGVPAEAIKPYFEFYYVIQPSFSVHGVEAVIKEFAVWARKEAKLHHKSPRAKAATPPFDELKWLAVLRLENARSTAKISFQLAQDGLAAFRRQHQQADPNGVFPNYASHGAWSKAKADAQRAMSKDASHLLSGIF